MPKAKSKREAKRLTDLAPAAKFKRPSKTTSKATSKSTTKSTTSTSSTTKFTITPSHSPTSKTITLYCPSRNITNRFIFSPTQSAPATLRTILASLNLPVGFAYDLHHRPITSYKNLQHDQTLLITTCYFERPLAEKKRRVVAVQKGPAEKALGKLRLEGKRQYVRERRENRAWDDAGEEDVRLTLPLSAAMERFEAAQNPTTPTSVEAHLATIQAHWGVPLDAVLGLRGMHMPYEEVEEWEEGLLGMLAVLSEATVGQGDLVAGWVVERMREKKVNVVGGKGKTVEDQGKIVEKMDVEEVGRWLYREALGREGRGRGGIRVAEREGSMGKMRVGGDLIGVVLSISMGFCEIRKWEFELKDSVYVHQGWRGEPIPLPGPATSRDWIAPQQVKIWCNLSIFKAFANFI